jgi:hypothetical protein
MTTTKKLKKKKKREREREREREKIRKSKTRWVDVKNVDKGIVEKNNIKITGE